MLNLQILTTKISSPEFVYREIWKWKPLNKRKENSLAQLVLGLFLSVSASQSSLCSLQVPKVLPASVAVHLSILRIQFAASVPYTSFVIQVMHTNTYLWASPWYFQNKCPCLTLHCRRVLLQKPFFSLLSLTDVSVLREVSIFNWQGWDQLFTFLTQEHAKLHESDWTTYPCKCYPATGQKWYFL